MVCHFVYSVPVQTSLQRLSRRIRCRLNRASIPVGLISNRSPNYTALEKWPTQSPFANTKNIYAALARVFSTKLYHLTEQVKIDFKPDDVFLGHPFFPYTLAEAGVTEFAVSAHRRPKTLALITPLHCNLDVNTSHINKAFLDHVNTLLPNADILFGIMGKYWWDQWDASPYAHWKSKMIRLDMALDTAKYPFIRKKFNKPGHRKFLYIGRNDPMKGIDFLQALAANSKDCEFGWIGPGPDIPGVKRIAGLIALTPEYMSKVAEEYDFFINTSVADPNPTTVLECMAWGFPVICTPQSGYYETAYIKNVYLNDLNLSVAALKVFQFAPEEELVKIVNEARKVVEVEYTWGKLTDMILGVITQKQSMTNRTS